ncbi:MAG TPA: aminoglycoside phosphotransferase family protein [Anaerolineales bacterium]|nr:aminoglycoside phosphotransferase family protein [Anaerolineales bacterium]
MKQPKLLWEEPEWLKQANDWILVETRRRAIKITGAVKQSHIYPWSTVMRVPTNEGTLFFKASTEDIAPEAALTQALAWWYPDAMPELVAVDNRRGWMLMRDGGEPLRASIRSTQDLSLWNRAITLYAEIQVGLAEHVAELLAMGVPDWRLETLPARYTKLLEDTGALELAYSGGLSSTEFRRLQSLAPRFAQICADLSAFGVSETLNHGDFHDGNVLLRNGRITLFDWGDGNLTHPFVSLRTFFVSIENSLQLDDYAFTPEMAALLDLYLEPWQRFASKEDLLSAFSLSRCVASIVKTIAWHTSISTLEGPIRQRYAGIVPELLKEFLTYERMLPT